MSPSPRALLLALVVGVVSVASAEGLSHEVSFEERVLATLPEDLDPVRGVFSPDGRRVAVTARRGAKELVYEGGKAGPECDRVSLPQFSPDGSAWAYVATQDEKQFVVLNGAAGKSGTVTVILCGKRRLSLLRGGRRRACRRWRVPRFHRAREIGIVSPGSGPE